MPMLHTINKSPFERRTLDTALRHAVKGAGILLIEDGVYAAFEGTVVADKVKAALADHKVYVLGPDVEARGMAEHKVIDGVETVDYEGFVDLVIEYDKVQSWL
ncbi:MAG TPA: sulfurtransferase complex subunit TusB [Gammaproteobacteria bacterium]|nr:sulfurtransferase complex subunit TusB [Gammaproteobacteria bacterium]